MYKISRYKIPTFAMVTFYAVLFSSENAEGIRETLTLTMSQVKGGEQPGSLPEQSEQSRDEPSSDHTKNDRDNNTERSPETNEARELRIEIIRKEGQRVRALRLKVSHFFSSMNFCSPNQFQPVVQKNEFGRTGSNQTT